MPELSSKLYGMVELSSAAITAALSLSGRPRNRSRCGGSRKAAQASTESSTTPRKPTSGIALDTAGWLMKLRTCAGIAVPFSTRAPAPAPVPGLPGITAGADPSTLLGVMVMSDMDYTGMFMMS